MARVHPIKGDNNQYGIFDNFTDTAVFPLEISNGEISSTTFSFKGGKVTEMDHKVAELIHAMDRKGTITKKSDGETIILDCSGIFNEAPFEFVQNIDEFNGVVKVNFKTGQVHFFEKLHQAATFTWTPKSVDHFEFRKEGRHPKSSHKIFSEVMQRSGFMFSEVFNHESCMSLTVDNMTEGLIGNLIINTFVGQRGQKYHRGIKMIQDSSTYIWPYLWADQELFNIKMGTDHKYKSIQFVCPIMKEWAENEFEGGITSPIILKVHRGRGRNHTPELTVSVTHQLANITQ